MSRSEGTKRPTLAAIGAGNYAGRMLLPSFKQCDVDLKVIASSGGVSGSHYGKKLGFQSTTTDTDTIFNDPNIDGVIVGTQHDSHAHFVRSALEAGKSVFVEKPLCITEEELASIKAVYEKAIEQGHQLILMVGYNRRFAPMTQRLKTALEKSGDPINLVYSCNAGSIPADSWVQDLQKGGGRIIGEACHFIDISRFLAASCIRRIQASAMIPNGDHCFDTVSIIVEFENGSMATVNYFANGHNRFPKEQLTVSQQGKTFILDNYRSLKGFGSTVSSRSFGQNKGQVECCRAFCEALRTNSEAPISVEEIWEVAGASIEAQSLIRGT